MRRSLLGPLAAALVVIALGQAGPAAAAEEGAGSQGLFADLSPDQVDERAADLLAAIRADIAAIARDREELASASTEDSLVLDLQISARREEMLAAVHELVDGLLELEKTGSRPGLRASVVQICGQITPRIAQ